LFYHKEVLKANGKRSSYKDVNSIKAHGKFPEFKQMREIFEKEGLTTAKMEVYVVSSVGGVKSRL